MFRKIVNWLTHASTFARLKKEVEEQQEIIEESESEITRLEIENGQLKGNIKSLNENLARAEKHIQKANGTAEFMLNKFKRLEYASTQFFYAKFDPTGNPLWDDFRILLDVVNDKVTPKVKLEFCERLKIDLQ